MFEQEAKGGGALVSSGRHNVASTTSLLPVCFVLIVVNDALCLLLTLLIWPHRNKNPSQRNCFLSVCIFGALFDQQVEAIFSSVYYLLRGTLQMASRLIDMWIWINTWMLLFLIHFRHILFCIFSNHTVCF